MLSLEDNIISALDDYAEYVLGSDFSGKITQKEADRGDAGEARGREVHALFEGGTVCAPATVAPMGMGVGIGLREVDVYTGGAAPAGAA